MAFYLGINNLECSLCQKKYGEPKILDCQHSFCEKCLVEYINRSGATQEILCPTCQRETVLPEERVCGLKTNVHLMEKVKEVSLKEKVEEVSLRSLDHRKIICEICTEGFKAEQCCLNCAKYICKTCRRFHKKMPSSSRHTIASLDQLRQGKVEAILRNAIIEDESECRIHQGQKQYFCEACDELVCKQCHRSKHAFVVYPEIASLERNEVLRRKTFPRVDKDIRELKERLAAASEVKQKFTRQIARAIAEVHDQAAMIRAEVTTEEEKMIETIERLQEPREEMLDEHEQALKKMLQGRQHSLQAAKEVNNSASERSFLTLYPIISKDLESPSVKQPPKLDLESLYLRFVPGRKPKVNLGWLDSEIKWELGCQFDEPEGKGPGKFEGAYGIAATRPGEIAVSDVLSEVVTFSSTEGQHREYIHQNGPISIAAISSGDNRLVVVDHTKYVKVLDKANKKAFKFTTLSRTDKVKEIEVKLRSVAVRRDGVIMVGDVSRMVWTEHSPGNGDLLRTVPVQPRTSPDFLAYDARTGRVVISSQQEQRAVVVDLNGDPLSTIEPTIGGKRVRSCSGVCCDSAGIYLAVDNSEDGSGHIHHYDVDGGFVECLAQGLEHPTGVTFTTDGQLAVADWNSVKIYHRAYKK